MIYPANSQEQWSYDPVGNLSSYTNRAGAADTYSYDNRNRLTNSSWNDGTTPAVSYTYDATGNLLSQTSSVSALSYSYDNANERTSETQNIAALGTAKTISYGYDADGNRVSKTLENGTSTAYSYDANNRLLTLNHAFGNSSTVPSQDFSYAYNSVGDRTSRSETNGSTPANSDSYSYDAIDQVTGVDYGSGRNVGYNYDPVGNRTSDTDSVNGNTSYTTNNLNQYTNVAAQVPQYDSNGNLTNINGWTYTYDAQNRLLSANNNAGTSETFAYDPQNRCVTRSLTVSGTTTTTNFLFDGWELIEELDGSGNELAAYVSGARVDELLTKSDSGGTVFYHHDGLGSTTALTDDSGNLIERYTYDVFGKPSIYDASGSPLTATAYGNRFLFTGREWLQEVALYDYRNRVYSTDLGRFLQTDPMRFAAGDVNIYRYVENDAVNGIDPDGEGVKATIVAGLLQLSANAHSWCVVAKNEAQKLTKLKAKVEQVVSIDKSKFETGVRIPIQKAEEEKKKILQELQTDLPEEKEEATELGGELTETVQEGLSNPEDGEVIIVIVVVLAPVGA